MKKTDSFKQAFTMVEVVFVIIVLGIVASIASELIAQVYESYIVERSQYRASIKTELAAAQIANRLRYAIPRTVYRIDPESGTIEHLESTMSRTGSDYNVLQWVGSDGDSFETATTPAWSGFCDVNASSRTVISTPGSNLSLANTIEQNLGNTSGKFALYFPYDSSSVANYGSGTAATITLDANTSHIEEHYKLAWSSYALVVDPTDGNLYLYYNFAPTIPTSASTAFYNQRPRSLILENVTTFKFKSDGNTIRFKICQNERLDIDINVTSCKEKAVF